jgi:excisionase family DNA binding protein
MTLTTLAARLEPLLLHRIEKLALAVEQGDEEAWPQLCASLTALEALGRVGLPERNGQMLTVAQIAERLHVTAKTARKMVSQGRLTPAIRDGRFVRFKGDEKPGPRRRIAR